MKGKKFTLRTLDEMAEVQAVKMDKFSNMTRNIDNNIVILKQTNEALEDTLNNSKINANDLFLESLSNLNENIDFDKRDNSIEINVILNQFESKGIKKDIQSVQNIPLELIDVDEEIDNWTDLLSYTRNYAEKKQMNLENPYDLLFSSYENVSVRKKLIEEFDLSHLGKDDYAIASGAGILAGIVDAIFVGTIGNGGNVSALQGWTDNQYEKIVNKFAVNYRSSDQIKNLDKIKMNTKEYKEAKKRILSNAKEKGHSSNIKFLEEKFKVLYDTTGGLNSKLVNGKKIVGINTNNHHLLSLGHDPGPLGLVFSIIDQLTGKATFIDTNGKIVRKVTENINLLDGNPVQGVLDAIHNWFGHCLSDVSGSSGSKNRGAGLPTPFSSVIQKLNFGSIPIDNKGTTGTFAQLSEKMYKEGYDLRSFTAQLLPILVYEVIVRIYWFTKQHFYFGKSLKESLPFGNNSDLQRMLFVSAGSFATIDAGHAFIKSDFYADPLTFFMTINYPGLINFSFKAIQNTRNQVKHIKRLEQLDEDIQAEWDRIILA